MPRLNGYLYKILVCGLLTLVLTFPVGSAVPASPPVAPLAPVAATGLVALLTKALPVIQQVVSAIFKGSNPNNAQKNNINALKDETSKGLNDLQAYLRQEQLLSTTVTSVGQASYKVAIMNQIMSNRSRLSGPDLVRFRTAWNTVSSTLDTVAKSGIDVSVMSDSNEKIVVTKIIEADGDLKKDIDEFLSKYKANAVDETSVAEFQEAQGVVGELYKRFQDLSDVSGVALKTVADALAAIVKAAADQQPASTAITKEPGRKPQVNSGADMTY
jgi:hypothetical protein